MVPISLHKSSTIRYAMCLTVTLGYNDTEKHSTESVRQPRFSISSLIGVHPTETQPSAVVGRIGERLLGQSAELAR